MAKEISAEADGTRRFFFMSVLLFFTFGFATVLNDTLIPKLKSVFALTFTEVMLTQFCFFGAYALVSLPAGALLARIGYIRGIVVGLAIMVAGCLLFTPAALLGAYPAFLGALFVLAVGITILQVAANSLIAVIGDPKLAESRLTLAQGFNSVATVIGPLVGAALILSRDDVAAPGGDPASLPPGTLLVFRQSAMHVTEMFYGGFALILVALAAGFWRLKSLGEPAVAGDVPTSAGSVWKRPRVALGAVSIFAYVGAEVSIGSTLVNYLMSSDMLGVPAATAGKLVSLYWGGAMVGRFAGSWVLTRVKGGTALAACAIGAIALALTSASTAGTVAAVAVIAVGLCNSIMFPTIFTLGVEGLGRETPQGAGLLCVAIVGGAIVPLIAGKIADLYGLHLALLAPAACYVWICAYGLMTRSGVLDRRVPTAI